MAFPLGLSAEISFAMRYDAFGGKLRGVLVVWIGWRGRGRMYDVCGKVDK